eukprot:8944-Heterococcus_DN1.PRE.2
MLVTHQALERTVSRWCKEGQACLARKLELATMRADVSREGRQLVAMSQSSDVQHTQHTNVAEVSTQCASA